MDITVRWDELARLARAEHGNEFVLTERNLTETVDFLYGTMAASVVVLVGKGTHFASSER